MYTVHNPVNKWTWIFSFGIQLQESSPTSWDNQAEVSKIQFIVHVLYA